MEIKCSKCKEAKPTTCFYKNRTTKTGYQHYCNECKHAIRDYKREYYNNVISGRRETERQARRDYSAKVRKEEPWKKRHYEGVRRARKIQATPVWANLSDIKEFYRNCPEGHEVDHIIPLLGETVCGLHVINNLQYLPRTENRRKSNKLIIEGEETNNGR